MIKLKIKYDLINFLIRKFLRRSFEQVAQAQSHSFRDELAEKYV